MKFYHLSWNACGHPVFEDCVRLCYQTIAENGGQFVPDSRNWRPKIWGRCDWWVCAACLASWCVLMITGHGALHVVTKLPDKPG